MKLRALLAVAALGGAFASPLPAEITLEEALAMPVHPTPPPAPERVLIRNATVWTMTGDGILEDTDVLLERGRIAAVGQGLSARAAALEIDGRGRHVTPGLIDAHSHTAVESLELNEGVNIVSSEVRAEDLLDPRSADIYRQLAGGVTLVQVLHGSANAIGGQSAIVKYRWGVEEPEALVYREAPPTIKFALGENPTQVGLVMPGAQRRYPATRMGVAAQIRNSFEQAANYRDEWARYNALSRRERERAVPPRLDLQLEPLVEVLEGRREIHAHSYRADEILMLIRLAEELGIRVNTFHHVLEGYKVADEMAAHGAAGSTFSDWWSFKMEAFEAIPHNAAMMLERGVLTSLNSDEANLARRMHQEAAKTLRWGGLSPEQAMSLVTSGPAKQLMIDDRVGRIAPGMDADVVIWSGDPLSVYSIVEHTFVEGRQVYSREADIAHQARVAEARERLAAELRAAAEDRNAREGANAGGPDSPAVNPPPGAVEYRFGPYPRDLPVAIVGATVNTLEGPAIENGVVVIENGRISAVGGPGTPIPAGAERVDAGGLQLWPGIIHLNTVLGIHEIDSVAATIDSAETGEINPDADTAIAVNASSTHFGVARSAGITHALVVPGGGAIAGSTTFLRTQGWTWEEMIGLRRQSMVMQWPAVVPPRFAAFSGGPKSLAERKKDAAERSETIGRLLDDAAAWQRARVHGADPSRVAFDPHLAALVPVLDGEQPVWAFAREGYSMLAAMDFAASRGLRVVLTDALQAYRMADELAERQVPVVLTNIVGTPGGDDEPHDTLYRLPAQLEEAGALFALASGTRVGGSANARYVTLFAGLAAAHGLDRQAAYRSITLYPARILGVDDVLGSIAPGKSASLVLTDGDLLEQSTEVLRVWIDGMPADLDDVQKTAYEHWRARPEPGAAR
ncbi:MAG: amidohydrolase family protein [Chromatiales bacterium]|nr:amidohydrolase family protein [Chromatiales bacterium]